MSVKGVGTAVNVSGFLLAPDQTERNQTEDQMFDPSEESLFFLVIRL